MEKKHSVIELPASESVINCAAYCEGVRVGSIEIDQISEVLKQPDRFVWIGLREPDTEMLRKIQKQFDLHELAIEDAHSAHQRPKIESYGESLFIVMRTAHMKDQRIEMGETHFFLGRNFIVTIRHGSSLSYSEVRQRCESSPNLLKKGPGFALYAVMDSIVDHYFPVIDELERELSNLEAKVFREKFRRETTAKIYRLKRQVLEIKRIVSPMIDICNRLMRFDLKMIDDDTKPYFRDVYDHTIRINEMIDNTRELLSAALEANLSMLSISQSEISKSFAGWAALIGIPTMVAGIYGMNFKYMPELDWKYGYPAVMTVTVGLCVALYLRFKKSGWL
ncbi:MAG: magnesium/cobalt transporter CorA [Bacteroidetes bacterium]|nr:magnesium/cobalt transporter CorA [Bacteroidota bacterium]